MTNTPPTDPNSPEKNALGFDEFIGILVAFATIGAILFWSFSRKDNSNLTGLLSPSATHKATPAPVVPILGVAPPVFVAPAPQKEVEPPATGLPRDGVSPIPEEEPTFPQLRTQPSSANPPTQSFGVVTPTEKMPTIPPPIAFRDVSSDYWGRRFIDALSSRGIIKGFEDYSFRPNQPVTRAEFAAILEQAFKKQAGNTAIDFKDVPPTFWATPAINQAIGTRFLKGYPDKTFKPDQKISRVQVLVALVSGLNLKVPSSPDSVLGTYKDAKDIPNYATEKVAAATANNLVVNYPDTTAFDPNKEATRGEVAAMVHQALVRMGRLQPVRSQYIVRSPR